MVGTQLKMTTPVEIADSDRTSDSNKNIKANGDGPESPELAACLRPIYTKFISDLNLRPLERFESDKLMTAVLKAAAATGVPHPPNSHSYANLLVGYSYADNCLPYHPFDVKVYVAVYTWLATLLDDAEQVGIVEDVSMFQERWTKGQEQPTVLLRAFADYIRLSYEHFHPLVANLIVSSSFGLLTATALIAHDGIKAKTTNPSEGGQLFPWYLRSRDGTAEGYAWFTFPKAMFPDLDIPIEAIEDINRFLCFANDVLSFYKEQLGGERGNYIHMVAGYSQTDLIETLKATSQETVASVQRIEKVLAGKGDYEKAWYHHKTGYIYMHIMRSRYRLWQLGIGDKPAAKEAMK